MVPCDFVLAGVYGGFSDGRLVTEETPPVVEETEHGPNKKNMALLRAESVNFTSLLKSYV